MEIKEIISHYKELSQECLEDIAGRVELITAQPGEAVVTQGEPCDAIYFNRNGLMRVVYKFGKTENTILFGGEGDVYTSLHSFFAGEPAAFSLIAVEETDIFALYFNDVKELKQKFVEFMDWLLYMCMGQLYALENRYVRYTTTTAEERYLSFLANDAPYIERVTAKRMAQGVPLKHIASYLNITPETFSRLRRKLVSKKENNS